MENKENLVEQNVSPKTRLFVNEASQNNVEALNDSADFVRVNESKQVQNQINDNNQFFVGEFPEWDLLPQTGFVRRIKKSNV